MLGTAGEVAVGSRARRGWQPEDAGQSLCLRSSPCSLEYQQWLSPFTAVEVRLRERRWAFFQGYTACEGQSQASDPYSRPCWYNHCSALPPQSWHTRALAPTGCRGDTEKGVGVRGTS